MNREKTNRVGFIIALLVVLAIASYKGYERYQWYELEKAEHEVDTMVSMNGIYEGNNIIVTDDGNKWEITDCVIKPNTEIIVIFQTNNLPVEQWEIVSYY